MLMLVNEAELQAIMERAVDHVRLAENRDPKAVWAGRAKQAVTEEPGWARVGEASALVSVNGPMCKDEDWIAEMCGIAYTPVTKFERAMSEAATAVGNKGEIWLDIDSPGGSVRGEADFLEIVRDVRNAGIRVGAYAHDLCCSAAYLLACQAEKILCGPQARVGSIGTVVAVRDTSEAYKQMGVKIHVVSSGGVKGMGTDGAEVKSEHIEAVQKSVDDITTWFVNEVAAGRKMGVDKVNALATGEVWLGQQAVDLKLCDKVVGFRELIRMMADGSSAGSKK